MSDITKLIVSDYVGKTDGEEFHASQWNSYVSLVANKINELIDSVNSTSGTKGEQPSKPKEDSSFYVNGVVKTPSNGKIILPCFGSEGYPEGGYVLSGNLIGQVVIGTSEDMPVDDTLIILNGVSITNNSTENAAILYMPTGQSLNVTLAKNKQNYIVCSNVAQKAESQKACIWSENNMVIQGNGYLACKNQGGHGIKASELRFFGNPHVYVDAIHDGCHGNAKLDLMGGTFYITRANDAFGTRSPEAEKTGGVIQVFKAEVYAYNITENVFDSKADGYIYCGLSLYTDVSSDKILSGIKYADPKVVFGNGVQNTANGGYTTAPAGSVKCYSDADMLTGETELSPSDGTYTLTTKYAKIEGYIEGNIVTSIQSTDIQIDGYVDGNIEYTATKKKLQVNVEKDTVGFVNGNISSSSNLTIEVKSGANLVVAGNVSGDELTLNDSKGAALICGDMQGKDVYVATAASPDDTKYLQGAFIIEGTMKTILNSKFNKGWIHVLSSHLVGVFCAKTIDVAGWADLDGSHNVFFNNAKGIVIGFKCIEDIDHISV